MRSKGPPPPAYSQLPVPPSSGESQGPIIQEEVLHQMTQAYQVLVIAVNIHQHFLFVPEMIHQTMEEMEVIQEETQKMMVMKPQELIKTYSVSTIENHLVIQTQVGMMEVEDVEVDSRLLSRSTSGQSRYLSWISLPEFIFRKQVR